MKNIIRMEKKKINMAINKDATKEQYETAIKSGKLIVVDFFATWCGPCQMYSPIFEQTGEEMSDIQFMKIDIDKENELAINAGVTGVPTTIIFKDGKEVDKFSGLVNKDQLIEIINKEIINKNK